MIHRRIDSSSPGLRQHLSIVEAVDHSVKMPGLSQDRGGSVAIELTESGRSRMFLRNRKN